MDKIEVSQRAREAAFDAYMTCFETVPNDLWLQALLNGKHDSDEMAQAFARFERDILATRTDATPDHVTALVEAAKAMLPSNMAHIPEWMEGKHIIPLDVCADELRALVAALAPFTKGQP